MQRFPPIPILHRTVLVGCVWLATALGWPSAHAGALFRCTGASGETVFSSSTLGYRGCKKIASFGNAAPKRAALPMASVLRVKGSAATTGKSPAADGADPISLAAVTSSVQSTATLSRRPDPATDPGRGDRGPIAQEAWPVTPAVKRFDRFVYYKVLHSDGSLYYGNSLPVQQKGDQVTQHVDMIPTCIACNLHSPIHWGSTALNLTAYADVIRAASVEYGVDEAFLRAIIHAESAFNPRALSLKGAQGLMQLMPATASDMGVMDAFDTTQNIRGGARYLGLLLRDFNGNEQLAAAAYNAGPGAVVRYSGVPPYAETQVYVERVGTLRKRYGTAIHSPFAANGQG